MPYEPSSACNYGLNSSGHLKLPKARMHLRDKATALNILYRKVNMDSGVIQFLWSEVSSWLNGELSLILRLYLSATVRKRLQSLSTKVHHEQL